MIIRRRLGIDSTKVPGMQCITDGPRRPRRNKAETSPRRPPSPILEGLPWAAATRWRPESVVSARITPLRLECFEQLPKHARRCVFWEVDPTALGRDDHFADPEFEKEAWLSMVMLEWGACGQIAIPVPAVEAGAGGDDP